jgi:hypothetical protein
VGRQLITQTARVFSTLIAFKTLRREVLAESHLGCPALQFSTAYPALQHIDTSPNWVTSTGVIPQLAQRLPRIGAGRSLSAVLQYVIGKTDP